MRIEFVETNKLSVAKKQCPWACKFAKETVLREGYRCFESVSDYKIYKNQK
jgi:hypothetical protein